MLTINWTNVTGKPYSIPLAVRSTFNRVYSVDEDSHFAGVSMAAAALNESWRFPPDMPFLEALRTCETLRCVRDAHLQPKGPARFNFPHFIIAGWPKAATTSLYM